jgi:hypothetical protein
MENYWQSYDRPAFTAYTWQAVTTTPTLAAPVTPSAASSEGSVEASATVTKSASFRRRRREAALSKADDDGQDAEDSDGQNPTKRPNVSERDSRTLCNDVPASDKISTSETSISTDAANESVSSADACQECEGARVPVQDNDEDPLSFIEIRSAAQWKAVSGRISWKFDEEPKEAEEAAVVPRSPLPSPCPSPSPSPSQADTSASSSFTVRFGTETANPDGFKPTKVQQLRLVCWKVRNKPS